MYSSDRFGSRVAPGLVLLLLILSCLAQLSFSDETREPASPAYGIPETKADMDAKDSVKTKTFMLTEECPLEFVWIPPGEFHMGSPPDERGRGEDEELHPVRIEKGFWIGKYEVTQGQWFVVTGLRPQAWSVRMGVERYGAGDNFPVYMVSWYDITRPMGFLDQITEIVGEGAFRLPSEAEWEYACRAGTTTRFYFGDAMDCDDHYGSCPVFDQHMWYYGNNGDEKTPEYTSKEVGLMPPNPFGLYDMAGNMIEWCQDRYHPSYEGAPTDGSAWEEGDFEVRVLRGGMWNDEARRCRSACRSASYPEVECRAYGFRLVWEE